MQKTYIRKAAIWKSFEFELFSNFDLDAWDFWRPLIGCNVPRHWWFYSLCLVLNVLILASSGSGGCKGGHAPPPCPVKIVQKRWPPQTAAYISCFLPPPLPCFWIRYCWCLKFSTMWWLFFFIIIGLIVYQICMKFLDFLFISYILLHGSCKSYPFPGDLVSIKIVLILFAGVCKWLSCHKKFGQWYKIYVCWAIHL